MEDVQRAIDANPWPYRSGRGHLGVKWRSGVEANKLELDRRIAEGQYTAAQALHRMTVGAVNLDGTPNGPRRPTLAAKWGPGGLASVGAPQPVVDAHVDQLKAHLVLRLREGSSRKRKHDTGTATAGSTAVIAESDEEERSLASRGGGAAKKARTPTDDDPAALLMLDGNGAKHPKIFVAKANTLLANQHELWRRVRRPHKGAPADCSIAHALYCMRQGGPLRRNWKAYSDAAVARHIDRLCLFLCRLRDSVRDGTFDGEPVYAVE